MDKKGEDAARTSRPTSRRSGDDDGSTGAGSSSGGGDGSSKAGEGQGLETGAAGYGDGTGAEDGSTDPDDGTMQQIIIYAAVLLLFLVVALCAFCRYVLSCCGGASAATPSYTPVSTEADGQRAKAAPGGATHSPAGKAAEREREIELQRSARMASMPSSYPKPDVPSGSTSTKGIAGLSRDDRGSDDGKSGSDDGKKKKPQVKSALGGKVSKVIDREISFGEDW